MISWREKSLVKSCCGFVVGVCARVRTRHASECEGQTENAEEED